MTQHASGLLLAVVAPVLSWQAAPGGVIEKLADQWPLIAVFFVALYLLFKAYQGLADRIASQLIEALNKNTAAFTEQAASNRRLAEAVEKIDQRLDQIDNRVRDLERDRGRH